MAVGGGTINAWSDTPTFKKWVYDIWLPFIRKLTTRPGALLIDNCGVDIFKLREQVTSLNPPQNCKDIHQPMNMGLSCAWELRYRAQLLQGIVKDLEIRKERRKESHPLRCGISEVCFGCLFGC